MQGNKLAVALGLLMVLATSVLAQDDRPREEGRRRRGPDFGQNFRPGPQRPIESTSNTGYVFVDGKLLATPYVIRQEAGQVTINGQAVFSDRDNPLHPSELAGSLDNNAGLFCFEGRPVVLLQDLRLVECLRVVSNPDLSSRDLDPVLGYKFPEHADLNQWRGWLSTYTIPEADRMRAVTFVSQADAARVEGENAIAANQRLSTWAYPLTVFGMLMSVVSFGHLLQFPPRGNSDVVPSRRRAELCRATVIFLIMVVVLSSLDLVWTLLTSQAGQMTELNPIGRELLNDPWQLAIFKVVATMGSCGLLLMLRRHPRAQLASWWMCLVCTLLTFRWLVLNSMFVA